MLIQEVTAITPKKTIDSFSQEKDLQDFYKIFLDQTSGEYSQKENNKFTKMRHELCAKGMGVSKKDLDMYYADFFAAKQGDTHLDDNRIEKLKRLRNIYSVQRGSNNNDKKDTIRGSFKSIAALIISSTILSSFVTLPVQIAACVAGVAYSTYRYNKRKTGNRSDEYSKKDDYDKQLLSFIDDVKKLDDAIVADREMLEDAKKNMSRRKFKEYMEEYLTKKVQELGIETPFVSDEEVKNSIIEIPEEANLNKNNDMLAEVAV